MSAESAFSGSKSLLVYVKVPDFHQNIRSYAASFDKTQLSSAKPFGSFGLDENCSKAKRPEDVVDEPCGLLYKTRLHDVISIKLNEAPLDLTRHDIVRWQDSHRDLMFGKTFKSLDNWQHDAVWMRPSPLASGVTKLYAVLDADQLRADPEGNRRLHITISGEHEYSTQR